MEEKNNPIVPDVPCIPMSIGKTTYLVNVHFSTTSTETMEDKIRRLLKNEISQNERMKE